MLLPAGGDPSPCGVVLNMAVVPVGGCAQLASLFCEWGLNGSRGLCYIGTVLNGRAGFMNELSSFAVR